jgi:hypothetical protein
MDYLEKRFGWSNPTDGTITIDASLAEIVAALSGEPLQLKSKKRKNKKKKKKAAKAVEGEKEDEDSPEADEADELAEGVEALKVNELD